MKKITLLLFACVLTWGMASPVRAQCGDTLINNGGFEAGMTDWWTWHGNAPDDYAFYLSDDSFMGDSSAVIDVLVDSDSIAGGAAEYNNRPQTIPVVGGQFYEISFAAKATVANVNVQVNVKDENDSWFTLHSEPVAVGTDWGMVTTMFQADQNRADVHIELSVFNGDINVPYQVFMDEICMTSVEISTVTCDDNLVDNPGFEDGVATDWWNWHSNNPTAYAFVGSDDAFVGDSSAKVQVLLHSDDISGPAEYNSRPQESAIVDGQNYNLSFAAKSSVENTEVSIWVKDEFDGWTTIHTEAFTIGTEWAEYTTCFEADKDRADVHVELKVFNAGFDPYEVLFDEISICTREDSCGPPPAPGPFWTDFGADETGSSSCSNNLAPGNDGFEPPNDTLNWDIWDGSDDEELSSIHVDPILAYSGVNSVRMDITQDHNTGNFHHRFGPRFTIEDGKEYTYTMWLRSNVPAGDTVHVLARVVRDTDWSAQANANYPVTSNDWLNFTHTFTGDGTWNNAFLELKASRWQDAFSDAYSIWFDDIQICEKDSATTTGLEALAEIGVAATVFPNPLGVGNEATLKIEAAEF
ncbi:MAG: carbohydrate binding domain-containing protein, partial [Bacteroidota bacterium]